MSPLELPPDPELELLAADLRAIRPEPDPAFLATLDARVAAGFPARAPGRAQPLRPAARRGRDRRGRPAGLWRSAGAGDVRRLGLLHRRTREQHGRRGAQA